MKNIHVLPTDKPSRLHEYSNIPFLGLSKEALNWKEAQHIYITSDVADINENNYIITIDGRLVQVSYLLSKDLEGASKVILTTDQDLIKDGVQAIDDEFLEWFVKNPSCEKVLINKLYEYPTKIHIGYKIIIPKEEPKTNLERLPFPELVEEFAEYYKKVPLVEKPKQVNTKQIMYNIGDVIEIINPTKNQPKLFKTHKVDIDFGVVYYYELNGKEETIGFSYIKKVEPKQETLEEASKNYANIPLHRDIDTEERYFNSNVRDYDSFIEGAKWQQEQDKNKYSEEEVLKYLNLLLRHPTKPGYKRRDIVKFIEQFKNK